MFKFAPAFLAALLLPAAKADSIEDIVSDSPDHTMLLQAATASGVEGLFDFDFMTTLFAPTNAAFDMVDPKFLEPTWGAHLIDILMYHSTANATMSSDLVEGMELFMFNYEVTNITSLDPPMINDATITTADIEADNGVVHVIDQVLLPFAATHNIVDVLFSGDTYLGSFSVLASLVNLTGLTEALSGPGPFTIFAPTDEAFAALDDETVTRLTTTEEGLAELTNILTYHVAGDNYHTYLMESGMDYSIEMLNGEMAVVSADGGMMADNMAEPTTRQWTGLNDTISGLVDMFVDTVTTVVEDAINTAYVQAYYAPTMNITINGVVSVDLVNILVSNGIMHVIDSIMMPPGNMTEGGDEAMPDEAMMDNSTMVEDMETAVEAAEAKDMDGGMV